MNRILLMLSLAIIWSCSNDDSRTEEITIATPVKMTVAEFRASIGSRPAQNIFESGKIYAYENYVLVNDIEKGIHIIDNTNPNAPVKIAFLHIPGNVDMAIKNNILYADSWIDLYVFDFSDPSTDIPLIDRLEEVLPKRYLGIEEGVSVGEYDFSDFDFERDVIVDWEFRTEIREFDDNIDILEDSAVTNNQVGAGGSLARFNIVDDYLYVVQLDQIYSFNISSLDNPVSSGSVFANGIIETIFTDGEYLYLGSPNGMFIYDIVDPAQPAYVSSVTHILGCDPVVVQGNYAYVTIRGGNFCGQQLSQLDVIDISDRNNPFIIKSIGMNQPYGLGVKENRLYVSDGAEGLVVFDVSVPQSTFELVRYADLDILDVIPQQDLLLMVGNNTLYNYEYTEEGIGLIASFSLN